MTRPDYKVVIQTGAYNAIVVLDVYQYKENIEIIGWRLIDEKGLEKMKRQANREGGQFLILSPLEGSAAALSALPSDLSADKDNANSSDVQAKSGKDAKFWGRSVFSAASSFLVSVDVIKRSGVSIKKVLSNFQK